MAWHGIDEDGDGDEGRFIRAWYIRAWYNQSLVRMEEAFVPQQDGNIPYPPSMRLLLELQVCACI
jgi:hypothetical protein